MKNISACVALALLSICSTSMAQWQWLDKGGRKVYSDRSPPPDVLDRDIVQRPVTKTQVPAAKESGNKGSPNTPSPESAAAGAPSGVDKDLEAKRKQATDAEMARKKAEEERIAKVRVENCAQAKQALASLDGGQRIARTNVSGEREVMDDAGRAAERARIQGFMASECR